MNSTGLIIGGKVVPCSKPVYNWNDHGMKFTDKKGGRKRDVKKTEINLFVLHWTAGEGDVVSCFNVLNARELGVEFYISREGEIFQFADPILVDTFDAGSVNPRSVGVEIANYGFKKEPKEIPSKAKDRKLIETIIRGHKIKLAKFYDIQLEACNALVDSVCNAITTIPKTLPSEKGKYFSNTMTKKQLNSYKGLIGHFQISENKIDPGTDLLEYLHNKGFSYTEV